MKDIIVNREAYVEVMKYVENGGSRDTFSIYHCMKEDLENFKSAFEKQIVKELRTWANGTERCSNCDHDLSQRDYDDTHCPRCGQRYKEAQRVNKGENING